MLRSNASRGISPSGVLQEAAEVLAETLNEMAWIGDPRHTVQVVDEISEARTPTRILLGTAAIEEYDLHEEAESLSYPAYIYRTVDDDLLIFGATSKGTANGVYGFLQDELGVRWFGPQELFTILSEPEEEGTIVVGELDRNVEPSFTGRFSFANWLEHPAHHWRRKMRLSEILDSHVVRAVEPFSGRGHYLHHIVPFNEYFESNPEYFRMVGGERRPHSNPTHTNLCWTNPEVVELAVEAARERFGRGDYYHVMSLGITDADAYCECEECVALQPERYFRGRSAQLQRVASDMYFHFVNEVARRVAEEYPDRYLAVSAYNDVTAPPLGEVEDNVFVGLVLDISEHYDPDVRAEDMELVEAWEEKGVVMGLGYYTGLAKLVPSYFPRHLGETLKDLHQRGFRGLTVEATPGWWRNPLYYVDARLWWDVDLEVDELLEEYFTLLYGPAAGPMAELYDLFEEIHMRPRRGGFLHEHYHFDQFRPYTSEDLERIQILIAQAHAAVEEFGTDRLGRSNTISRPRPKS